MSEVKNFAPALIAAFMLPFAFSSVAQEVDKALKGSEEESQSGIEVIEVVAQKRVSTLQETPIAISAFNSDSLAKQQIEDAHDIQFAIPNAMITGTGTRADYSIRGVGANALSASGDPGAGVHINGVYMASNNFQNEFFDVRSIEVLRGPQGTLYGRNTTAGVVNILTAQPSDAFEGNIGVEFASHNSIRTNGMLNIPLTDMISQRFAFYTTERDGYTKNIAENVGFDEVDGRDQWSIRSTTRFEISDNANATLFAQYFEEDSDRSVKTGVLCKADATLGCASEEIGHDFPNTSFTEGNLAGVASFVFGAFTGLPYPRRHDFYNTNLDGSTRTNPSDPREVRLDYQPRVNQEETIVSFEFNYDFGDVTFTSLTGYHDKEFKSYVDFDNADGADAFLVPMTYQLGDVRMENTTRHSMIDIRHRKSEQWSQELRLSSYYDAPFNYTVGAFYLDYDAFNKTDFYVPELGIIASLLNAHPLLGLDLTPEEEAFSFQTPKILAESWALFGEGYYDVNKDLKLTVGLRYTEEEKEVESRVVSPLSYLGLLSGNPADTSLESGKESWEEVTGKVGLSYQLDKDTMFFGSLSRGYKGGGINPGAEDLALATFDPEYINAIEIGTKNTLFDRTFQANITAFLYDYDGLQVSGLLSDSTVFNTNVDAEVKGAEFEFISAPSEGLQINLNVSFLDSEISESFITAPDNAYSDSRGGVQIKGNELPHAPKTSVQFGVQYEHQLNEDWSISYRAQTYWQDKYWARLYNSPTDRMDSWQQTDANVTLRSSDNVWELEAFVKNASDEASLTGLSVEGAFIGRFRKPTYLEPRTFGLRVKYRFD